jgi:hypothetical protein
MPISDEWCPECGHRKARHAPEGSKTARCAVCDRVCSDD